MNCYSETPEQLLIEDPGVWWTTARRKLTDRIISYNPETAVYMDLVARSLRIVGFSKKGLIGKGCGARALELISLKASKANLA